MHVRLDRLMQQCITPFENAFMAEVDGPQWVNLTDPNRFVSVIRTLIASVREKSSGTRTVAVSEYNNYHSRFYVQVTQAREHWEEESFLFSDDWNTWNHLCRMATQDKFESYSNFAGRLDLNFNPISQKFFPQRQSAWNLVSQETPWDDQYQILQTKAKWRDLRSRAYRYAGFAQGFAKACSLRGKVRVLCPAAGFCIDPWILAHAGLEVEATDLSPTAIEMVQHPEQWPPIYSQSAWRSWEAEQCCDYGGILDGYNSLKAPIPDLIDPDSRQALEKNLRFHVVDNRQLPFAENSIDAIFACNAVPRQDAVERRQVFDEWFRVLKPNGILFLTVHNGFAIEEDFDRRLKAQGLLRLPPFRSPWDLFEKWKPNLLDTPDWGYYSLFLTSG